jgi:hypothetical protein
MESRKTPTHRPPPSPRGYISPLGGATAPYSTDNQIYAAKRDRAQTPRGLQPPGTSGAPTRRPGADREPR